MSYILDALRKADAERERDPARGIHARAASLPPAAPRRGPLWAAAAVAVLAVIAGGYAFLTRPAPTVAPAPLAAPVVPKVKEAAPAAVVIPVAAAVTPAAPPAVATTVSAPVAAPATDRVAAKAAVPPTVIKAPVPAAPVPAASPPAVAAAPAPAPVAAPAADRVLAVADLPADVQRELPKLQISGGVHSDNPSQRLLIVGGQVMNEGAEIAPGVVLEQIRARTAVLKFRGYRYSVGY